MDSLEYSTGALEAKALFYNKKITLFVEGIDDPLFWYHFTSLLKLDLHIEDVGGGGNIENIINKIIEENAEIYVAIDRDYIDYLEEEDKNKYINNKILLTYGHSIENTLYNPLILNEVIKNYVKKTNLSEVDNIISIYKTFENSTKDLLIYDILSNKLGSTVSVFGDSCMRHLKSNKSVEICTNKMNQYINSLGLNFNENDLTDISSKIDDSNLSIYQIIKGHFLTSLIINIIRLYVKKLRDKEITINTDNLYSLVIDKIHLINELDEYDFYLNECKKINYA